MSLRYWVAAYWLPRSAAAFPNNSDDGHYTLLSSRL
jgi:hypothetical protein